MPQEAICERFRCSLLPTCYRSFKAAMNKFTNDQKPYAPNGMTAAHSMRSKPCDTDDIDQAHQLVHEMSAIDGKRLGEDEYIQTTSNRSLAERI